MEHALILLAIGLLLNVFHKVDSELIVIPRDTEVMVNELTYMNCSTSLEAEKVQWYHGNKIVYTGRHILEPYNVRFSVEINSSTGTSNLVIRSVQPSDAGQYECLEDEGSGERRSAQLIVLDDDPVCKSNLHSCGAIGPNSCGIEPDEIKLSCSITYHGNIFPNLQWKASGDNQSITEGLSNFTSSKNVTYTLTMKSTLDLTGSSFICQTTRSSNRNYSCSSDVIKILYILRSNVTIKLTMDDKVSCFANTSQSCSYKWKWISGNDSITVSNDQTLIPNRVGTHRCEATCSLGYKSCTVEPMYAEVYSTLAPMRQNLLALLVLFALPAMVLIGIIIYCRTKIQIEKLQNEILHIEKQPLEELERKAEQKREQERQRLIVTLKEEYKFDPVLVHTICKKVTEGAKNWIKGMTILDKELFVVSDKSSEVKVYEMKKFSFSRAWDLKELIRPLDIASCNRNKCLYIFDYKGDEKSKRILRVDPNGKLIKNWSTGGDYGLGLSVTDESNVILTVHKENKLKEYSSEGVFIREINLSSNPDICYPYQAIKLKNGHFVVSHAGPDGDRHGVCVVEVNGNLRNSIVGKLGSITGEMKGPFHLAVDGNGFVMIADEGEKRVVLMNPDLEFQREIIPKKKHGLVCPFRILLDQTNRQLFVANEKRDYEDFMNIGQILIFDLGKQMLTTPKGKDEKQETPEEPQRPIDTDIVTEHGVSPVSAAGPNAHQDDSTSTDVSSDPLELELMERNQPQEQQRLIAENRARRFYIKSELNEKVLGIENENRSSGSYIIMWNKKERAKGEKPDSQLWYCDEQEIIRSSFNGLVLDSSADEIAMQKFDPNNPNQAWIVKGSSISRKANPDIVLGIKDSNKENRARICAQEKDGGLNQKWKIEFE